VREGTTTAEPLTADSGIGPYRVVRLLGRGGMAVTWLAEEEATGRQVVLKFPDVDQLGDPAIYERFRREVEIGRTVDHPAVPKALELREDNNRPYVVMEFVSGRLLADVLHEEGALPVERAVNLCAQLLDALEHLHTHGISHRDLKPENLMVTPEDEVRIIDFGLALLDGHPRVTWRGFSSLAGTPSYMAPEQIRGERGGPASDVYAAGVILYEMLAGRVPFSADNPLAVMHQALNDPLPPLSHRRNLPPGLENVVARALHRDRAVRYSSARAFREDLLHPEGVTAPPPAPAARPSGAGFLSGRRAALVPVLAAAAGVVAAVVALLLLHAGR
jgi:serine/threonine protein kinase